MVSAESTNKLAIGDQMYVSYGAVFDVTDNWVEVVPAHNTGFVTVNASGVVTSTITLVPGLEHVALVCAA